MSLALEKHYGFPKIDSVAVYKTKSQTIFWIPNGSFHFNNLVKQCRWRQAAPSVSNVSESNSAGRTVGCVQIYKNKAATAVKRCVIVIFPDFAFLVSKAAFRRHLVGSEGTLRRLFPYPMEKLSVILKKPIRPKIGTVGLCEQNSMWHCCKMSFHELQFGKNLTRYCVFYIGLSTLCSMDWSSVKERDSCLVLEVREAETGSHLLAFYYSHISGAKFKLLFNMRLWLSCFVFNVWPAPSDLLFRSFSKNSWWLTQQDLDNIIRQDLRGLQNDGEIACFNMI